MKKFLKFLGSPLFIGCGAVVLALLLYANWKQVETARGIKAKIGSLSDQANSLQQKSSDLLSTINSLKQAGATEKLAREQLNLKEPGEFVYSFAPQETGGGAAGVGSGNGSAAAGGGDTTPNPEKWYNYFFRGGS